MPRTALLLVPDPALRRLLRLRLGQAGVPALEAEDGPAGVGLLAARRADVAVVVTGLRGPGLGGAGALDALRAAAPDVPVFLFTSVAPPPEVVGRPGVRVFPKPDGLDDLCRAVARAAGGAGPGGLEPG